MTRSRQYDKAIVDYSEYIRLEPNYPDGYTRRANCYEKLGNAAAAERHRAKAKELTKQFELLPVNKPNATKNRSED